jgi:hypothetical protein
MKNPYEVLFGLANNGEWQNMQNVTKQEIVKAYMSAVKVNMKVKKYSSQELMIAQKMLLNPSKRLAADFMFPAKYKTKRPVKLKPTNKVQKVDLATINENTFDNLDTNEYGT